MTTRCGTEICSRSEVIGGSRAHRTRISTASECAFQTIRGATRSLKVLDDEIVATCSTDDIDREVGEAEEVYEKIVESLKAIE